MNSFLEKYCIHYILNCYPVYERKESMRVAISLDCSKKCVEELYPKENIIVKKDKNGRHITNIKNVILTNTNDFNKSYYLAIIPKNNVVGVGIDYISLKRCQEIFANLKIDVLKKMFYENELKNNIDYGILVTQKEAIYKAISCYIDVNNISFSDIEIDDNIIFHGLLEKKLKNIFVDVKTINKDDGYLTIAIILKS